MHRIHSSQTRTTLMSQQNQPLLTGQVVVSHGHLKRRSQQGTSRTLQNTVNLRYPRSRPMRTTANIPSMLVHDYLIRTKNPAIPDWQRVVDLSMTRQRTRKHASAKQVTLCRHLFHPTIHHLSNHLTPLTRLKNRPALYQLREGNDSHRAIHEEKGLRKDNEG